jgi:hypothetical protein
MKRYEQSIRVVTTFFSVLLGFGIKRLLDAATGTPAAGTTLEHPLFTPASAAVPCLVMIVCVFLRFLLGSNNHMWLEYVLPDAKENKTASRVRLLVDFAFVGVFGVLGLWTCYSPELDTFLLRSIELLAVALAWVSAAWIAASIAARSAARKPQSPPAPKKSGNAAERWVFWVGVNLAQLIATILALECPKRQSNWVLWPLALVYAVALLWDLSYQLQRLGTAKSPE